MVRLSELIKKSREKKTKDDILTEAFNLKPDTESPLGIRRIYEDTVDDLRKIMLDVKDGKTIEAKELENLADKIVDMLQVKIDTFLSLVNNFSLYEEEKDFLYNHSLNVAILVSNIGLALGYHKEELVELCISGLVHDIGMLKIPLEIVNKPEQLTGTEFEEIKKHPIYGLQYLANIKGLSKAAVEVVYHHHDKVDGTGYPEPKRGKKISKFAQIIGIAEIYEALTHTRPYRNNKIIPSEAVKIIVKEESNSFENDILRAFLNYVTFYPVGSYVILNTSEIGKVIKVNKNFPLRPVIEVILDAEGRPLDAPKPIDLTKSPVISIDRAVDEDNI